MSDATGIGRRGACVALGAALMFSQAAGRSQCPAVPPPLPATKQLTLKKPGSRVCCIFWWAKGLDPKNLKGHKYGNGGDASAASSKTAEPVGYVYTAAAGLVDIGHVRDNADMTLWVYANLQNGEHNFRVGNDTVAVGPIPSGKVPMLALAGAIVYVNSWAHELGTWGDTPVSILKEVYGGSPDVPAEDFSAFSPEDMSSNIVGIIAATRAINAGGDVSAGAFDTQMDTALAQMMPELGAQEASVTDNLVTQVEFTSKDRDLAGKWWTFDQTTGPNMFVRLLRRNFDGTPWKIAGAPTLANPKWMNTT
jgi:hypothetical protein